MVNKKSTPKKERKRHIFQFSFKSGFLLSIGFFFVLGWVFFLGILVGRGLLPDSVETFSFIKKKIAKDEPKKQNDLVNPIQIDELSFYNQLIDKKEKAKKQVAPPTLVKHPDNKTEKKQLRQVKEETHNYSIQVVALKDKTETEKMVRRLIRLGYQAYYYQIMINGDIFYRIRCGPYSTIEKAKQYAKMLSDREGFNPFIVHSNNK